MARRNFRSPTILADGTAAYQMTPTDFVLEITANTTAARSVTLPNSRLCNHGDLYSVKLITYDSSHAVTIGDLATESNQIVDVVLDHSNEIANFICTRYGWALLSNTYA
jgi:hypothetical protein